MLTSSDRLLFFDLEITGHHVEYLYHLVQYRIRHPECAEFVLFTHPEFISRVATFDLWSNWQKRGITVVHPSPEEIKRLGSIRSVLIRRNEELKVLHASAKKYDATCCYLMMLNQFQFALGADFARRFPCSLRGILFNPFSALNVDRHFAENLRLRTMKFRKYMEMLWMLRNGKIDRIFVLNDPDSAEYLNNRYGKEKLFASLPDPICQLPGRVGRPVYNLGSCQSQKHRFLLFGSLGSRKGIFAVLSALHLLPDEVAKNIEVVFAGKVIEKEYGRFKSAIDSLRRKRPEIKIIVQNRFIDFKDIPFLFSEVDCVLIPYAITGGSSGVIGHSALYGKPVIGPTRGLVGRLIRSYGLGIDIEPVNASNIAAAITDFTNIGVLSFDRQGMRKFVEERLPNRFVRTLIDE